MPNVPHATVVKWGDFVRRLVRGTEEGVVEWDESDFVDGAVTAKVGRFNVVLNEAGSDFEVRILNEGGSVVDYFTDNDISTVIQPSAYGLLSDLHRLASRAITGADLVLDEIIGLLPEPPKKPSLFERKSDLDDDIPF